MSEFHLLDLIVIAAIVGLAVLALLRGFVAEFVGLVAWIAAAYVAARLFEPARPFAQEWIPSPLFADIATGAGLFVAAMLAFTILGRVVINTLGAAIPGPIDRSLGFLFGLGKGVIVLGGVYLVVSWLVPPERFPTFIREARVTPLAAGIAQQIEIILPDELRARLAPPPPTTEAGRDADDTLGDRFRAPRPQSVTTGDGAEPTPGYNPIERQALDRLIQDSGR